VIETAPHESCDVTELTGKIRELQEHIMRVEGSAQVQISDLERKLT
jgi:hypothetical protein